MYSLVIDGQVIREEETTRPLIEELRYYAQGTGFESATIVKNRKITKEEYEARTAKFVERKLNGK